MKTSVIIIAHNEEQHIAKCIESLLAQTEPADEIILVAHNCTDRTEAIAANYPITVVPYAGPQGVIHARIKGLEHCSGEYVLSIDGDSYAAKHWIKEMVRLLQQGHILVGSWIRFKGALFARVSNWWNWLFCSVSKNPERWIWGASIGYRGEHAAMIADFYRWSLELSKELHLSRNPDDYWLALLMSRHGSLAVTNRTWVTHYPTEISNADAIKRNRENTKNGNLMRRYFKDHPELR
jgi:glycosyltransferase involved in cell wall biosynthesis